MSSRIAIILLNWNAYFHSRNCLYSLSKVKELTFDLILVDNASTDDSFLKLKKEFPHVQFIQATHNLGFTGGNNVGFKKALESNYEYVMLLNNDVFVDPNYLYHLINCLDFNPEVGALQPLIYHHPNRNSIWNGGGKFNRMIGKADSMQHHNSDNFPREIDWISGCAFMIRMSLLNQVGLFNEKYFAYYEDVDLSFRIREAGYKLMLIPNSVIYHIGGGSSNTPEKRKEGYLSPDVHYYNTRNHIWIIRRWLKWYEKPTAILYHAVYSISLACYFLLRFRWNKLMAVAKGFIHGFSLNYQ
jgi:GT2 family glycosyltransferase